MCAEWEGENLKQIRCIVDQKEKKKTSLQLGRIKQITTRYAIVKQELPLFWLNWKQGVGKFPNEERLKNNC